MFSANFSAKKRRYSFLATAAHWIARLLIFRARSLTFISPTSRRRAAGDSPRWMKASRIPWLTLSRNFLSNHKTGANTKSERVAFAPDVEVSIEIEQSTLYNKDLAPVPKARRTWRVGSFAALWISMSACIPTYMLASSLIGGGMNWSQAILTIFLGNLIVVVPMILNAHAGTRYGIPFPVLMPRLVRHSRRQRPRAHARVRRLRLVWNPDLDRRRGDLQNPRRLFPRPNDTRRAGISRHHARGVCLLPLLLERSTCSSFTKASSRFDSF